LDRGFQLINANYPELKLLDVISAIEFVESPRAININIEGQEYFLGDTKKDILTSALNARPGSVKEKLGLDWTF
jgi:hypothetical protein